MSSGRKKKKKKATTKSRTKINYMGFDGFKDDFSTAQKFVQLATVWGYRTGPRDLHEHYESEINDGTVRGRNFQYITDPVMRSLSNVRQNKPVNAREITGWLTDTARYGAIYQEDLTKADEPAAMDMKAGATALLDRFFDERTTGSGTIGDMVNRLATFTGRVPSAVDKEIRWEEVGLYTTEESVAMNGIRIAAAIMIAVKEDRYGVAHLLAKQYLRDPAYTKASGNDALPPTADELLQEKLDREKEAQASAGQGKAAAAPAAAGDERERVRKHREPGEGSDSSESPRSPKRRAMVSSSSSSSSSSGGGPLAATVKASGDAAPGGLGAKRGRGKTRRRRRRTASTRKQRRKLGGSASHARAPLRIGLNAEFGNGPPEMVHYVLGKLDSAVDLLNEYEVMMQQKAAYAKAGQTDTAEYRIAVMVVDTVKRNNYAFVQRFPFPVETMILATSLGYHKMARAIDATVTLGTRGDGDERMALTIKQLERSRDGYTALDMIRHPLGSTGMRLGDEDLIVPRYKVGLAADWAMQQNLPRLMVGMLQSSAAGFTLLMDEMLTYTVPGPEHETVLRAVLLAAAVDKRRCIGFMDAAQEDGSLPSLFNVMIHLSNMVTGGEINLDALLYSILDHTVNGTYWQRARNGNWLLKEFVAAGRNITFDLSHAKEYLDTVSAAPARAGETEQETTRTREVVERGREMLDAIRQRQATGDTENSGDRGKGDDVDADDKGGPAPLAGRASAPAAPYQKLGVRPGKESAFGEGDAEHDAGEESSEGSPSDHGEESDVDPMDGIMRTAAAGGFRAMTPDQVMYIMDQLEETAGEAGRRGLLPFIMELTEVALQVDTFNVDLNAPGEGEGDFEYSDEEYNEARNREVEIHVLQAAAQGAAMGDHPHILDQLETMYRPYPDAFIRVILKGAASGGNINLIKRTLRELAEGSTPKDGSQYHDEMVTAAIIDDQADTVLFLERRFPVLPAQRYEEEDSPSVAGEGERYDEGPSETEEEEMDRRTAERLTKLLDLALDYSSWTVAELLLIQGAVLTDWEWGEYEDKPEVQRLRRRRGMVLRMRDRQSGDVRRRRRRRLAEEDYTETDDDNGGPAPLGNRASVPAGRRKKLGVRRVGAPTLSSTARHAANIVVDIDFEDRMQAFAMAGDVEGARALYESDKGDTRQMADWTTNNGHRLSRRQDARLVQRPSGVWTADAAHAASVNGHLDFCAWLLADVYGDDGSAAGPVSEFETKMRARGLYEFEERLIDIAAYTGNVDMLRWIQTTTEGHDIILAFRAAAMGGQLALIRQMYIDAGDEIDAETQYSSVATMMNVHLTSGRRFLGRRSGPVKRSNKDVVQYLENTFLRGGTSDHALAQYPSLQIPGKRAVLLQKAFSAAYHNRDLDTVNYTLSVGAQPVGLRTFRTDDGYDLLGEAATQGQIETIRALYIATLGPSPNSLANSGTKARQFYILHRMLNAAAGFNQLGVATYLDQTFLMTGTDDPVLGKYPGLQIPEERTRLMEGMLDFAVIRKLAGGVRYAMEAGAVPSEVQRAAINKDDAMRRAADFHTRVRERQSGRRGGRPSASMQGPPAAAAPAP
jgi:hypothetical protein